MHCGQLNHMEGPRGPIGPQLSHKLCSSINITLILSMKAAVNCSHHELHMHIHNKIKLMLMKLVILGVSCSFFKWIFGEINKNILFGGYCWAFGLL